jgi:hypothetical protein
MVIDIALGILLAVGILILLPILAPLGLIAVVLLIGGLVAMVLLWGGYALVNQHEGLAYVVALVAVASVVLTHLHDTGRIDLEKFNILRRRSVGMKNRRSTKRRRF